MRRPARAGSHRAPPTAKHQRREFAPEKVEFTGSHCPLLGLCRSEGNPLKAAWIVNWGSARADDYGRVLVDLCVFIFRTWLEVGVNQGTGSKVNAREAARGVTTTHGQVWWQWLSEAFEG